MANLMSERQFQRRVLETAHILGWKSAHFDASVRVVGKERKFVGDKGSAGFPDLVLVKDERLLFVELKADKGRCSANQLEWLNLLAKTKVEVYCWRPSEWDELTEILRGRT